MPPTSAFNLITSELSVVLTKTNYDKASLLRVKEVKRLYSCELCEKSFATNSGLRRHQLQCGDKEPQFDCPFCSKRFFRNDKKDAHIRNVHVRKKHKAQLLNRISTGVNNDSDEIPFLGWMREDDDDDSFFSLRNCCQRLPELRIDKIKKLYQCEPCKKSYANVHNLRRHQLQCGGKEPQLACAYCKIRFYRRDKLRNHVRKMHGYGWKSIRKTLNKQIGTSHQTLTAQQNQQNSSESKPRLVIRRRRRRRDYVSSGIQRYACRGCGAVFTRKDNLRRHEEIRCNKEKTVSCNFCPSMFYDKYVLKRHIHNVHKVPIEMLPSILEQDEN